MFDTKLTAHLAELSKLSFTKEELSQMTKEMDVIVDLMNEVQNFSLTQNLTANQPRELSEFREDIPQESLKREKVLANAKEKSETSFAVPKVV